MNKQKIRKYLRIFFAMGFFVFLGLLINEMFYQPYRMDKTNDLTKELYHKPSDAPTNTYPTSFPSEHNGQADNTARDDQGRLIYFQELLKENPDTKGWIQIPDSNIDYVVMQNATDPEYYLHRDFNKEYQKSGCVFIDKKSTIENTPKNVVIHGHNMRSTNNMFHYLEFMKDLDYFKKHTTINFDTIYQTGRWKIISVFITNGSDHQEPFFEYTKSNFRNSSEFLNFVYQLKIRSLYNIDSVDINENDQLVTLSTCTYELKDYRLVVVARKERPGETSDINPEEITENPSPVYPKLFYEKYHKQVPNLPATFEEALNQGLISWYKNK